MAKQRNSLGVCVLDAYTGGASMSFDEYKKRTGIDLNQIFINEDLESRIAIRTDFSKILYVYWGNLLKALGWGAEIYPAITPVTPHDCSLLETGELAIQTGDLHIVIDISAKTITGGDY